MRERYGLHHFFEAVLGLRDRHVRLTRHVGGRTAQQYDRAAEMCIFERERREKRTEIVRYFNTHTPTFPA